MSSRGIHTWSGSSNTRWPLILAAMAAIAGVVLAATIHWAYLAFLLSALILGVFARIRATVDLDGLTVVFGYFGWPKKRLPLEKLKSSNSIDLNPWKWGGWGYRWLPGRGTAVVNRRGPAIVVERSNGKVFAVTVDDAPSGAAVLQSHLDHQPPA